MQATKVYQVMDDSIVVLVTTDEVKAALALMKLAKKYEDKQTWFGVSEDVLQ